MQVIYKVLTPNIKHPHMLVSEYVTSGPLRVKAEAIAAAGLRNHLAACVQ